MDKETNDSTGVIEQNIEEIEKNNENMDIKTENSVRTKNLNKKKVLIGGAGVLIIAGLFFTLNSPIRRFERALKNENPSQAIEIYNDSIKGNLDYESKIKENTLEDIRSIKNDYLAQKITFEESKNLLSVYQKIESIKDDVTKIQNFIKSINDSRKAYSKAEESLAEGDIKKAIKYFFDVSSIDEDNFEKAQEQIESLKETYLQNVLNEAEESIKIKNYDTAVSILTTASELFPKEESLSSKKEEANKLLTQQKEAAEKEKIEKLKAEQKLTVTKAYSEGSYIYSHGFAIVKNNTNQVVKNYTVGFLMFDNNGYPVNNTHSNLYGKGNLIKGESNSPNIQPGSTFGNNVYWMIEGRASKVKACVIEAEFYDGTTWENPYFEYWYEAEKDRY